MVEEMFILDQNLNKESLVIFLVERNVMQSLEIADHALGVQLETPEL